MTNKLDTTTTLLFDTQNRKAADKPKQAIPDRIYVAPCAFAMATQTFFNSQDPSYKYSNRPQF